MSRSKTDLEVPEAAYSAAYVSVSTTEYSISGAVCRKAIDAAAPVVVAAAYLKLAERFERRADRVPLQRDGTGAERRTTPTWVRRRSSHVGERLGGR